MEPSKLVLCINLVALRVLQSLLLTKWFFLQLMQRGVVCLQGLPDVKQVRQQWSLCYRQAYQ